MPKLSSDEVGKVIRQNAKQCQTTSSVSGQDPDIAVLLPRPVSLTTCHVSRRAFEFLIVHEFLQTQRSFPTSQRPTLRNGESTRNFTTDAEREVRKFELRMAQPDLSL